ncbi:hypothetical protein OIU76_014142 [Salix suchowensis]|nr:hypothetical protein OIU76_014142 [Salix suchowensis]
MGTTKHADSGFLTLLLQDQIGGLQVLYENQWIEVTPMPGALVVNVGDLFQLISNDQFISATHRVVAKNVGPRTSVECFFRQHLLPETLRLYGPIKELLSEEIPPGVQGNHREGLACTQALEWQRWGLQIKPFEDMKPSKILDVFL